MTTSDRYMDKIFRGLIYYCRDCNIINITLAEYPRCSRCKTVAGIVKLGYLLVGKERNEIYMNIVTMDELLRDGICEKYLQDIVILNSLQPIEIINILKRGKVVRLCQ